MNIQQFDEKMITITKLRKDIDALEKVLKEKDEAVVVRNQDILFVAVTPKRYQELKSTRKERVGETVRMMDLLRSTHKFPGSDVSKFIVKMRDERALRWKK